MSYRNKGWDLLQLWNFWVCLLCKDVLGSNGMSRHCLIVVKGNRINPVKPFLNVTNMKNGTCGYWSNFDMIVAFPRDCYYLHCKF